MKTGMLHLQGIPWSAVVAQSTGRPIKLDGLHGKGQMKEDPTIAMQLSVDRMKGMRGMPPEILGLLNRMALVSLGTMHA